MSSSRIPSPARSVGAPVTPRRHKPRGTRSVGSPARSTTSRRLSNIVDQFKDANKDSFAASPLGKTVLNDNTDIEMPRRKSWWKKVENSRDVSEVLENDAPMNAADVLEEFGVVLTQEKKNYTLDLPDSSGSESIHSIVLPQRKLFVQKENMPMKNFGEASTSELKKTNFEDQSIHVSTKNLFGQANKRPKLDFPSALLNLTTENTLGNKTVEPKVQTKGLFGNRQAANRKNIFADFVVSESEEEILEIQSKRFTFNKKSEPRRSSNGSSITTDIEMDDWKLLPSSTMVDHQLEEQPTPCKRARLSKLSEAKESTNADSKQSNRSMSSKNKSKSSPPISKSPSKDVLEEATSKNLNASQNKSKNTLNKSENFPKTQDVTNINEVKETSNVKNKTYNINKTITKQASNSENVEHGQEIIKDIQETSKIKQKDNNFGEPEVALHNQNEDEEMILTYEDNDLEDELKTKHVIDDKTKTICVDNRLSKVSEYMDNLEIEMSKIVGDTDHILEMETPMPNKSVHLINKVVEESPDSTSLEQDQNIDTSAKESIEKGKSQQLEEVVAEKVVHSTPNQENIDKIIDPITKPKEQIEAQGNNQKQTQVIDKENVNAQDEQKDYNIQEEAVSEEQIEASDQDQAEASQEIDGSDQEKTEAEQELEVDDQEETKLEQDEKEEDNEVEMENQEKIEIGENRIQINENNEHVVIKDHVVNQEMVVEEKRENNELAEDDNAENVEDALDDEVQNELSHDEVENKESENEASDAEVQYEASDDEAEHEASDDEVQYEASNDEVQHEASDDEVQHEASDDEVQHEASDDEVQHEASDDEVQHEASDDEAQQEESDDGVQHEASDDEAEHEVSYDEENLSQEIEEENEDEQDEEQNESHEIVEEDDDEEHDNPEDDVEENESGKLEIDEHNDQEIEDENIDEDNPQQPDDKIDANITHDTTGRNRKKGDTNTPEDILHDAVDEIDASMVKGRNTSIRKTILNNFTVHQSMPPARESTGLSDGTKNSSTEGSGWDSHRTTRKTLRQTFGKDFTPRKSLRTLVMEKSAKRQTLIHEANAQLKLHQANSTELPDDNDHDMDYEDQVESDHEVSRRTRQTKLEMYLQKIKKDNVEMKQKIEEQVQSSLQPNPSMRATMLHFKPNKLSIRRGNSKSQQAAPKIKRVKTSAIPLENLPPELLMDMKYKPPKRFKPSNASWITNRLYKFLESKLEPKYDYKARIRAEKLVETMYNFVRDLRRMRVAAPHAVAELKREMARLDVVRTHFEFYCFFKDYMPYEVKTKVVPDILNDIPLPREGIFAPIIE